MADFSRQTTDFAHLQCRLILLIFLVCAPNYLIRLIRTNLLIQHLLINQVKDFGLIASDRASWRWTWVSKILSGLSNRLMK